MQEMSFKFRHKVLLALGSIVILALGTFLGISLWRLQLGAEQRAKDSLENARAAFHLSREQQARAVTDAVSSLASTNPELRIVLASRGNSGEDPFGGSSTSPPSNDDLQTLESSLPFLPLYARADQLVVRDREGNVLLAKNKEALPAPEITAPVSREALSGKVAYDWWKSGADTFQVFAVPVTIEQDIVGSISVGYRMDEAFLRPLARISHTLIDIAPPEGATSEEVSLTTRQDGRYLQTFVPIQGPEGRLAGGFLVSRSLDEEMREADMLRNQLLGLGALVLLLALGMALYLSRLVSAPLEILGKAVRAIGTGDLKHRIHYRSRDEFGELGHLIDGMAAGLEERERIRAAFSRYVDDDVVNEVLKKQGAEALRGEEKNISVLFADLANFTSFAEGKSPERLLKDLNSYFAEMAKTIAAEKGVLDKFIGDAVMAYWGAPVENPDHAILACTAALAQARMFREKFAPTYPGLGLRIGLSTGIALVGSIGSEERQNYTAMGDTVNLASRLEGVNKSFGTMICLSEATYLAAKDHFEFRLLGDVKVAGRQEAEKIYELLGEPGSPEAATARAYEEALGLFESGDLEGAARLANELAEKGDGPSKSLLLRCREGLGPNWSAAWSLSK